MSYDRRKKAISILEKIKNSPQSYLFIHYSCESFCNIHDGRTPRITSIAVRNMDNAQTTSFSIHKIAEKRNVFFDEIKEQYDVLEREMLKEFFKFVKDNKHSKWIHLNMRDINFGFQAIEHRYEVLNGHPFKIDDNKKIDLARLLRDKYGEKYIDGHPRFKCLIEYNGLTKLNFLTGAEEAEAFEKCEYIKLHQSTLRKVDLMQIVTEKAIDNTLKTKSKWYDIYGITPQGIFNYIKDNWFASLIFGSITCILGVVIENILQTFLQKQ